MVTPGHRPSRLTRFGAICLAVFLLGAAARIGFVAALAPRISAAAMLPDEVQFWDMAGGLAEGRGLADELGFRAGRMPLYPAFLALFQGAGDGAQGRLAALLVQALLAAAACPLAAWIARQAARGVNAARTEAVALVAGCAVAVDPFLVYFSRFLLTENLFIAAMCAWWALSWPLLAGGRYEDGRRDAGGRGRDGDTEAGGGRDGDVDAAGRGRDGGINAGGRGRDDGIDAAGGGRDGAGDTGGGDPEGANGSPGPGFGWLRWLGVAAALIVCVYLRPSAAGLAVAWAVWVLGRSRLKPRRVLGIGACAVLLVLALLPWAARNHRLAGHWTWLTSRGGISLYDGVHPGADGSSDLGAIKRMDAVAGLDEAAYDAYFRRQAWKHIYEDPARIASLALVKLKRTWSLWPNAEGYQSLGVRLLAAAWTTAALAAALAGAIRVRRRPGVIVALLLPALYFTALHMLFVGSVRYRLPAMPMILALGSLALIIQTRLSDPDRGRPRRP